MGHNYRDVDDARQQIAGAIAGVRAVAQAERDQQRMQAADRLDSLFVGTADWPAPGEATREALALFRGGAGSFQDVGTEAASRAVDALRVALERGFGEALERGNHRA